MDIQIAKLEVRLCPNYNNYVQFYDSIQCHDLNHDSEGEHDSLGACSEFLVFGMCDERLLNLDGVKVWMEVEV